MNPMFFNLKNKVIVINRPDTNTSCTIPSGTICKIMNIEKNEFGEEYDIVPINANQKTEPIKYKAENLQLWNKNILDLTKSNIFDPDRFHNYCFQCILSSYKAENREFNIWFRDEVNWVMIRDDDRKYIPHVQLFYNCKYDRVKRRTIYRITHNATKNFGIIVGESRELRFSITDSIYYGYTVCKIKFNGKYLFLSIFTDHIVETMENAYIKLRLKYWGMNEDEQLDENDPKNYLPNTFLHDWDKYVKLYEKTFSKHPCDGFNITSSKNIEVL